MSAIPWSDPSIGDKSNLVDGDEALIIDSNDNLNKRTNMSDIAQYIADRTNSNYYATVDGVINNENSTDPVYMPVSGNSGLVTVKEDVQCVASENLIITGLTVRTLTVGVDPITTLDGNVNIKFIVNESINNDIVVVIPVGTSNEGATVRDEIGTLALNKGDTIAILVSTDEEGTDLNKVVFDCMTVNIKSAGGGTFSNEFFGPWTQTHDAGNRSLVNTGGVTFKNDSAGPDPVIAAIDNGSKAVLGIDAELDLLGNAIRNVPFIEDPNNKNIIDFANDTDAVNHIQIKNGNIGKNPQIITDGADADIDLKLAGKNTGSILLERIKFTPVLVPADVTLGTSQGIVFFDTNEDPPVLKIKKKDSSDVVSLIDLEGGGGAPTAFTWASSDEDSPLTTGIVYTTEVATEDRTLSEVKLTVKNAPTAIPLIIDIFLESAPNSNNFTTSIFSTLPQIEITEFYNTNSVVTPVISVPLWNLNRRLQIKVDTNDTDFAATGLKVALL